MLWWCRSAGAGRCGPRGDEPDPPVPAGPPALYRQTAGSPGGRSLRPQPGPAAELCHGHRPPHANRQGLQSGEAVWPAGSLVSGAGGRGQSGRRGLHLSG